METNLTKQDILELFKEQDRRLEESQKRFDKRLEESRKEQKIRDKKFDKQFSRFESRWSAFVESLVRPGLIKLFLKQGIELNAIYPNVIEYKNKQHYYEIDLFAINGIYAVAVEVKTTLTVDDIKNHLQRMQIIIEKPPHHFKTEGKILLGAVAGITIQSQADKYAQKNGLFVLKQEGNMLGMLSPANHKELKFRY